MNLLFFTPANKRSAVGRMGALVVRELLTQGHAVTVIQTESTSLLNQELHEFHTTIISWNALYKNPKLINAADQFIYQVGNEFSFHEGALYWMMIHPGVVCLHDFYLGNLFRGWADTRREEANVILRAWYGDSVANQFFSHSNNDAFIEATHDVAPLTEWIGSMALGIITHSASGCERLMQSCPGPVQIVPLAYDADPSYQQKHRQKNNNADKIQILTVSHHNPNKQIETVIQAIAASPFLKDRVTYKVVGYVSTKRSVRLLEFAKQFEITLEITGDVDDLALTQSIQQADIISCLHWPTLETASTIEAMLYGKHVIVTDAGFYKGMPSDCVFKISLKNEIPELVAVLERLINFPHEATQAGARAKKWATETFTATQYADSLLSISKQASKSKPVLDSIQYFTEQMSKWSGGNINLLSDADISALSIFEL